MWQWLLRPKGRKYPDNDQEQANLLVLPTSDLWDLVLDFDWERIIHHSNEYPEDAAWTDGHWHESPLYFACQHNPPLNAIQALIRAYPPALLNKTRANKDLPIHIACRYQLSEEILDELLKPYPGTSLEQTRWGRTPLMALWEFRPNRALNERGSDIVDDMLWRKVLVLLAAVARFQEHIKDHSTRQWQQSLRQRICSKPAESRTCCNDELQKEKDNQIPSFIHAAACLGALGCPLPILDRLLHEFPGQVFQRNSAGQLPLHIAVGAITWNTSTRRQYKPREKEFISRLLDIYPDAALVPDIIDSNRYPLHSAILNRHTWEEGVKCLLYAAPEVVMRRDPVTQLYPFQLAALSIRKNTVDLDTIYMLLRSQPDVLTLSDYRYGECTHSQESSSKKSTVSDSRPGRIHDSSVQCTRGMTDPFLGILVALSIGGAAGVIFGNISAA